LKDYCNYKLYRTMQQFYLRGQKMTLHPFKGMYWVEQSILFVADLHLGKATHFRKAGIPVPKEVRQSNFDKFTALLLDLNPERVLILGDLFHSDCNTAWEDFVYITKQFAETKFELVVGNHDIMDKTQYEYAKMKIHPEPYDMAPFILSHHPMKVEDIKKDMTNLCGHIHPAVYLRGFAKQAMKLPCFHFTEKQGILPAFGEFTGTAIMRTKKKDQVFVVSRDKVIEMQTT